MNEWMKSIFLLSQRTFINEKECVMHLNVYDYEIFVNYNVRAKAIAIIYML